MILTWLLRILLAPFAALYGVVVNIRHFLYQTGLLRSSRFDIPTISVGNLSVGGSGKTPHIEYLIRLLTPYMPVAVLSRGYKRKTDGFRMVETDSTALEVGDEPLQFKRKYPSVTVAVGEKRAFAIPQMLYKSPETRAILLDDAFQHLAVSPFLNVMLTEYQAPFFDDFLLPAGRLRESRRNYRRADIIVVTKCPFDMTTAEKQHFLERIKPHINQRIYFSYYAYNAPYLLYHANIFRAIDPSTDVLLVTGIAKSDYLLQYLKKTVGTVQTMEFEDHRLFSNYDVAQIKHNFDAMKSSNKIILTTEKDATRLDLHKSFILDNQMDIFVLPIEVQFLFGEQAAFDEDIKRSLLNFKI